LVQNWLEYSVERDAAFASHHAATLVLEVVELRIPLLKRDTFTKEGFRDWKHATGKEGILQGHASCLTHIQEVSSWHKYKLKEERGTSVAIVISTQQEMTDPPEQALYSECS